MLGGIERGEPVDTKQGRKKQRLKAATQRLLPVMHQGTVVARLCTLMGLYRLRQPGHHRAKGIVLVEPVRKEMHAYIRQTRRDLDERCTRGPRRRPGRPTRATLAPVDLPGDPQAIE